MAFREVFPQPLYSSPIPIDDFRPRTTVNTTPILVGTYICNASLDQGMGGQGVFVPRDGLNGAFYHFTDQSTGTTPLGNGIWNYWQASWGGIVNYHRWDNAALVLTGATKIAGNIGQSWGGDAGHDSGTRGSFWTYTQTGNRFLAFVAVQGNGGIGLVAIDENPLAANGFGVQTVLASQTGAGQFFDNAIIPSLPAPWNTLSTLEGCKYINSFSPDARSAAWRELWNGTEGSHTIKIAATNTGSGGGTNRVYLSAMAYQSATDAAITSTYAPPSPGVNTSGRTIVEYATAYFGLSMQEFLERYQPTGTSAQFNGGNHTDGFTSPVASGEAASTGFRTVGQTTSGSASVTSVGDTGDLQDGDRLVIFSTPVQVVQVQTPSGKTASTFNLSANSTVNSRSAAPIYRADWTVTSAATSNVQALTGTNLPAAGDVLYFINTAGSAFSATVISVSGSNLTLDRSVTTTTGMYVVLMGKSNAVAAFYDGQTPIFARPYEIIVASANSITSVMRHTRSHPQIMTTLSAAPARGATTVSVTSATGLAVGQTVQIHAPRGRYVGQITGISGTTITVNPPLDQGFASGVRFGRGTQMLTERSFRVGDTFSMEYNAVSFGYFASDAASELYTAMHTTNADWNTGKTWDYNGTATNRAWANTNADSSSVSTAAVAMNHPLGYSHITRIRDSNAVAFFQTRSNVSGYLSKTYFTSRETANTGTGRPPNTQISASFSVDVRNVTY